MSSSCSYCYGASSSFEECFSWQKAKVCCGIEGPNDPKYLNARISHHQQEFVDVFKKEDIFDKETADKKAEFNRRREFLMGLIVDDMVKLKKGKGQ